MKRNLHVLIWVCFAFWGLPGCQSPTPQSQQEKVDFLPGDVRADSLSQDSLPVLSFSEPDGVFDDFVYRFMRDADFQLERIDFPLLHRIDGVEKRLSKSDWTYDSIYSEEDEYTAILDGKDTIEHVCDSTLTHVCIEVVNLKAERVKLFHFEYKSPYWKLCEIDEHAFDFDDNHDFFSFYSRFANDEEYQARHIHNPFYFKTFDSDNFQEIGGYVPAESWGAYRTYLPNEKLINTLYENQRPVTDYRTFIFGSPSSGVSCTLLFKRIRGQWFLVRMEN